MLEKFGIAQARKILAAEEAAADDTEPTLNTFAPVYIDGLTGISEAQKSRYRAYLRNDLGPVMGDLPLPALCAADDQRNGIVQDWVSDMEVDGVAPKTIANKHGFLSGCLKVAVRRRLIPFNPCDDTRLPKRHFEPCFLEPEEFDLLLDMTPERWKPSVRFLALSCVRWSEFTAMPVGAIRVDPETDDEYICRVSKAWKYTGTAEQLLGGPKSRRGVRSINVPSIALEGFDLDRPPTALLVCTKDGTRVSAQLFHNKCWQPLADDFEALTGKRPRVHDLRHTGASWMLSNGAEITDVQRHLGHESAQTTTGIYGHFDRRSGRRASTAMSRALVRAASHGRAA
ncbi:tyrosine-type recombinase/integrase [Nocardia cyriacigeorgica]|uniref:Tyrosine-type recombinase/integrase n=1 Tax=Nocardia cyriacigeorgica TaxID=135487 RepID=A0A6P1CRA4_9NOCA|nr:tyrosine-type recombinase/integrase [Nocardia cyriacigeorgica]NEW33786.1 tyrosine-type recombinase/integrase [Nocardia cyriacigeorgica]